MSKIAALLPAAVGGTAASAMPLALASMALSGIGGLMQGREQDRAKSRRDADIAAVDAQERVRQQQLQAQSQQALDALVQRHSAQQRPADIQAEAQRLTDVIAPTDAVQAQSAIPSADRASQTVRADAARRMSETAAETRERLSALAGLSAYDTNAQELGTGRASNAADEAVRGSMRTGGLASQSDANRLFQQDFENFQPSGLSRLLSGAGQLGSLYAGSMPGTAGSAPSPWPGGHGPRN